MKNKNTYKYYKKVKLVNNVIFNILKDIKKEDFNTEFVFNSSMTKEERELKFNKMFGW